MQKKPDTGGGKRRRQFPGCHAGLPTPVVTLCRGGIQQFRA